MPRSKKSKPASVNQPTSRARYRTNGGSGKVQVFIPWDLYYLIAHYSGQKWGVRDASAQHGGLPNMSRAITESLGEYFRLGMYTRDQRQHMALQAKTAYEQRGLRAMASALGNPAR